MVLLYIGGSGVSAGLRPSARHSGTWFWKSMERIQLLLLLHICELLNLYCYVVQNLNELLILQLIWY